MQPDPSVDRSEFGDKIFAIGQSLAGLDPGPLAELRRMSLSGDGAGAPYFWRLASRHDFGAGARLQTWARIIQIMAVLTDKGQPEGKRSPHAPPTKDNGWRGLGHALCDGADPAWGNGAIDPRPILSELRFARLIAARGSMRAELMERAGRALAAKKPPGTGVNCIDLAWLLVDPGNPAHTRKLARNYYARLDRARRNDEQIIDTSTTGDEA